MQNILQDNRDENILTLIEQNKLENRGAIAEQLARTTNPNRWVNQIASDIELVHNGEQTWDWFYGKHGNNRNTFKPHFTDGFFRKVYEYFQSEEYTNADM